MKKEQYTGILKRLAWLPMLMLGGCNMALFDPKGQVGADEKSLIITATLLMLIVVVPVILMTLGFAWKYRASNTKATYMPDWSHSTKIELVVWLVPCLIISVLGWITWESTHKLDPYRPLDRISETKPLDPNVQPLEVQVVSMDWKWLFLYPEQGIATVNEFAAPVDRPIRFKLTATSTMAAFCWVA